MSDRLLVSTRKGLFTITRESAGWRVQDLAFVGENVTLAHVTTSGIFAALNLGHFGVKLRHLADGGKTWEERAVPVYPEGEVIHFGDGKPTQPASLKMIWSLETAGNRLWAGTLPGGLFYSEDGGQSWHLNRGLWDRPERQWWFGGGYDTPGIHSICVDPRDGNTLRLAISTAGVWRSTDAGGAWDLLGKGLIACYMPPEMRDNLVAQDVHRMVQCASAPERLWIQHHCGIFRSDDGAQTWHEIKVEPSSFGFAVAVHPRQPDTAWFVPAVKDECRVPVDGRFVVTRTRDGGKTFDVLSRGLPQERAYDLVYRHGMAIDTTGDRLAIGSTTGGLWVSEDQGDRWQELSERLPPIHAVCFA